MMRNIAIGLAAATIVIGGSTLSASTLYGQESSISKGSMSGSVKSDRNAELTPLQRERLKGMVRERYAELTPLQRERLKGKVRERFAELTPMQRERLRGKVRERYEQLTPLERERLYRHGPFGRR
jgi:hypothetical protein